MPSSYQINLRPLKTTTEYTVFLLSVVIRLAIPIDTHYIFSLNVVLVLSLLLHHPHSKAMYLRLHLYRTITFTTISHIIPHINLTPILYIRYQIGFYCSTFPHRNTHARAMINILRHPCLPPQGASWAEALSVLIPVSIVPSCSRPFIASISYM